MNQVPSSLPQIRLPNAPVLIADQRGAVMLTTDGELITLDKEKAISQAKSFPPILCHAKATARYLKTQDFPAFETPFSTGNFFVIRPFIDKFICIVFCCLGSII